MPEKYKIFPGNKYFMDYSRVIGPFKKKKKKRKPHESLWNKGHLFRS